MDNEMIKISPLAIILGAVGALFYLSSMIVLYDIGYSSGEEAVMYNLSRRCYPEGSFVYHQGVEYYAFTCRLK